ncbi:MAG: ribosomal-protein-alanine N-acetyltransferase [Thermoprotei archaeon]|nr:ribosomal protein S18-alanine N-acetyltransferase [Thermoproteales archaeon]RLE75271.1 MAG: ribosomal-protein-alanine N-acetyltransferase [Thermoprotei archaeon]RLE75392.1 MAG: ribosomal-protein-alanine N-acetyltransferase [Thermoprotei archaeon]RLE84299.1 MAG: ribosomal-protein-alanine N-acetyltransferase [Thermoprotei archaeon]
MSSYIIREFKPSDLETVLLINKTCLPENYPAYFFMQHHVNFPKSFLVAENDEKIVGYVMCRVEHGLLHTKKIWGKKGHIISIAVIPEERHKGIGKALMKKALEALKNVYKVDEYYLEVRVTNTVAINLYRKLGFSIVKRLKGYYLDGEDAFLMAMKT